MGQNIDLNSEAFSPISGSFTGVFDGRGKTIKNINMSVDANAGLFLDVGVSGHIKNLGIEIGEKISGSRSVGSLVAENHGTISNCYAKGKVYRSSTEDNGGVGGLVGSNSGTIISSHVSEGLVGTTSQRAGGLVGFNEGTIISSYALGNVNSTSIQSTAVSGGLVGRNSGMIISSYARVAVTSYSTDRNSYGGGLVGVNINGTIVSSYATGIVKSSVTAESSMAFGGGLIGNSTGGHIISSYSTGAVGFVIDSAVPTISYGGSLVGLLHTGAQLVSSYGFGDVSHGVTVNQLGSPLPGVSTASALTQQNSGWSASAWSFDFSSQGPALKYVDNYSKSPGTYVCTSTTAFFPLRSVECGTTFLPDQLQ